MPECPIEKAQAGVLMRIAESGKDAAPVLSEIYLSDEIVRAAMKGLVFENVGNFARSMVVGIIGECGGLGDMENVLMHLLGHEKGLQREKYRKNGLDSLGTPLIIHHADKSGTVREKAVFAVERILRENGTVATTETERALVKCALLDPSEKIRVAAARVVGRHGKAIAFNHLLTFMINAEKANEKLVVRRGKEAVAVMVENMKAERPRGSLLKPLMGLSNASPEMWAFAEKTIMELFYGSGFKRDIQVMAVREKIKLDDQGKKKDRVAIERLGSLLEEMGEDPTTPIKRKKKMTSEEELDCGELMRPPAKMGRARGNDEPVEVPRGPVVTAMLRAGKAVKKVFVRGTHK
ncbi:hypothetical protein GF412_02370 [Candidatus Micrarchaeota archaeon]|nr:hypothetical protein [Candidatus Micrarchaeota archaeon]MBD3417804.1 hypothetical protein [Candidatus Micrarchaeota archaeon]